MRSPDKEREPVPVTSDAIEAEQKEKGEGWTRNDRLIAIATHAQTYDNAKKLSDLRPHPLDEIKEFFVSYNKLRDRKFPGRHTTPVRTRRGNSSKRGNEDLQEKAAQGCADVRLAARREGDLRRCAEVAPPSVRSWLTPARARVGTLGEAIVVLCDPQHRFPRNKVKSRKQAIAIGLSGPARKERMYRRESPDQSVGVELM